MKRDLLIQMRNEWRDNVWLVVGLTVVSLAIWWLTMDLFFKVKGLFYEKGFDIEDVYRVDIRHLPMESPDYIERGEEERAALDSQDLRMLIANIRKSPYVEVAAFSQNGLPYQYSYRGNDLFLDMEPADTIGYPANLRTVSPEMVRVLKVTSRTGKSEAELENILREGGLLISNVFTVWSENVRKPEELNGKTVKMHGKTDQYKKVGDIVNQIRRSDYDVSNGGMALIPINEVDNFYAEAIGIRMKPGMGEKFREAFENDAAMRVHGNYYLTKLTKMGEAAKSLQKKENTSARMGFALIVSLLLIIGLGMLGVFWFRMQQRVGEIAIRKVCGANATDIFRRLITEGIILLAMATLLAAVIGWPLLKTTFLKESAVVPTVVLVEAATFVIVAAGVTLSLWWPAKKAMSVEPAVAIKDE